MTIINNTFRLSAKIYNNELFSVYVVAYFIFTWLNMGNAISVFYNARIPIFTGHLSIIYLTLYSSTIILIIIAFFKEIKSLTSKYVKIIVSSHILLLLLFVYAPPRNADAMRVWLAKIYDIVLNGEKILRPYAHYNTPDTFTLFHLPLINLGDGQMFQLSIVACFACTLILLIRICKLYDNMYITNTCILLFIFNPLITLGSTVIISDMPLILSFTGIMYSIAFCDRDKTKAILLLFLFIAFGLNIKYNSLMIVPAISIWLVLNYKLILFKKINILILLFLLFTTLNAVYPYLMNYIFIGNPVWPALTNIFPANIANWDIAARNLTQSYMVDERTFTNFVISIYHLLSMPHHINPIIILLIPLLFQRFKYVSFMPLIIVSTYLIILWFLMPRFAEGEKQRYVLYLFPIIIPYGIIGFAQLFNNYLNYYLKIVLHIVIIIPTIIYFSFNLYYSSHAMQYLITNDKFNWHRDTWYYNEYNWINNNIELNGEQQIMVYAYNQQTYYLRKKYINIDPLSGYFKDNQIYNSTSDYIAELKKYNIAYYFVDIDAANARTKLMITKLIENGSLIAMKTFSSYLSTSRIFNQGSFNNTVLYKVNI